MVTRGFYRHSWAHYADVVPLDRGIVEEVMFGLYDRDGGTDGEMAMRWYDLPPGPPAARLEAFDDAWDALGTMPDLLATLSRDGLNMQPDDFCDVLASHGFHDRTKKRGV